MVAVEAPVDPAVFGPETCVQLYAVMVPSASLDAEPSSVAVFAAM